LLIKHFHPWKFHINSNVSLRWNQDSDVSVCSVAAALARILITSMLLFSLANNWYIYYYLVLALSTEIKS
jgi:hypothetical protein